VRTSENRRKSMYTFNHTEIREVKCVHNFHFEKKKIVTTLLKKKKTYDCFNNKIFN